MVNKITELGFKEVHFEPLNNGYGYEMEVKKRKK